MIFNDSIEFLCMTIILFNQPINTTFSISFNTVFNTCGNCFSENYQFIIPQVAFATAYLCIFPPTLNSHF